MPPLKMGEQILKKTTSTKSKTKPRKTLGWAVWHLKIWAIRYFKTRLSKRKWCIRWDGSTFSCLDCFRQAWAFKSGMFSVTPIRFNPPWTPSSDGQLSARFRFMNLSLGARQHLLLWLVLTSLVYLWSMAEDASSLRLQSLGYSGWRSRFTNDSML